MRFQLTDEQRALQDAVRSYLRDRFGPAQVRALYEDPASDGVPADLWRAMGEQGWLAVLVPEEHDGIGLGLLDAAVLAREFGTGTVPGPWTSTVLLGEAVRLAGSPEQQAEVLPALAAGELKGAVALLRPGSSTPAGAPATAAATKNPTAAHATSTTISTRTRAPHTDRNSGHAHSAQSVPRR